MTASTWSDWFSWQTALTTLGLAGLTYYTLRRLRQFAREHSRRLIDGFFWIMSRFATRNISAQLSMRRYCRNRLGDDTARFLQVPGVRGTALDVDEVFVPLTLELGGHSKTFSNENLLGAGNRLLVVGDPGSGKTTLIKRVFRDTCTATYAKPRKGKLPIQLDLKTLHPSKELIGNDGSAGSWMFARLREEVEKVDGFEMAKLFDACSTDSGLLILLDGLDEVGSDDYHVIAAALRGLSRRLTSLSPRNAVVVTMRIQFHQQVGAELIPEYPQTLYVRAFMPSEIFLFLNRWPFGKEREKNVNRIYTDLTDRPTLREMCSNPLVLAMYVQNDQEFADDEVPDTRTEFYKKVVNELLVMRRHRQELVAGRAQSLREQREEILGQLALENLTDAGQAANSLSWQQAIEVGARVWQCAPVEAEKRLRELASETGIITEERRGETFSFIHLTFCEFLAAIECAGRMYGWRSLLVIHRKFVNSSASQLHTRLIEVIPFTHALLPRVQRIEALSHIAELADRLVLGRCFLETQLYDRTAWADYLEEEQKYLASNSGGHWVESRLRRLHLFSVVVRDARDWSAKIARRVPGIELPDVFAGIVGNNKETLVKLFTAYASQDAAAAFRLADQVGVDMLEEHPEILIDACQEEPFLALALERAKIDQLHRWANIIAEAALKYANVAHRLNSTTYRSVKSTTVAGHGFIISRIMRIAGIRKGSYYERFLNHVIRRTGWTDPRYPAIGLLNQAMKRRRVAYLVYFPARVIATVYLLMMLTFTALVIGNLLGLMSALAGVAAASYAASLLWVYSGHYWRLYASILNLPNGLVIDKTFRFPRDRGGTLGRSILRKQRRSLARMLSLRLNLGVGMSLETSNKGSSWLSWRR
jgi:hypothetical protein